MALRSRLRRTHLPLWLELPVLLLGRLFYRVKVRHQEHFPRQGGVLMVANHISYVDALVLLLASPRRIRFVGYDKYVHAHAFFVWLFRISGTIPISSNRALEGMKAIVRCLRAGEVVCLFPEGGLSRTGQLQRLNPGLVSIARMAHVPVLPVAHDGLWGSIFSFAGNKYIWKSPRLMPTSVAVVFGAPFPPDEACLERTRKALLDLGAEAFEQRPILKRNLAREAIRSLAKSPHRLVMVDRTLGRRPIRAAQLLSAVAVLSRHLRKTVPGKRVGIVLPPGGGGTIANLAVSCAGKIPVNLNFTAGRAALEASMRLGQVDTLLTANQIKPKFPSFPWPEDTRDLREDLAAAGGKLSLLTWLLAAYFLPNQIFANLLKLPKTGDREEASLLFTSGSSGEPKGVILTHRNILANCSQVSSTSVLPRSAILVGCLPIFHSFGCTITLWYPLLRGCRTVTIPSPLDTRKIIDAIHEEQATVMLGAPTFIRPFLKKAESKELKSLELVVCGAEKLSDELYDAFMRDFHIELMQGYGITETSPVTNVNQPNPTSDATAAEEQLGKRKGSVGRLLPGMSARIVDPDTGEELPSGRTGIVWLKGANVFQGYLGDPQRTAASFKDGWFITGDLGRFDEDGFLYIEGRLSRFSKIGGEMVPHGTVEQTILNAFGWELEETPLLCVVGLPDPTKGEQLILLTTKDLSAEQLREALAKAGVPSLWIPKTIKQVQEIPVLGTGKLDLKGCRQLAENG